MVQKTYILLIGQTAQERGSFRSVIIRLVSTNVIIEMIVYSSLGQEVTAQAIGDVMCQNTLVAHWGNRLALLTVNRRDFSDWGQEP